MEDKWIMLYATRRRKEMWNEGELVWMLRWINLSKLDSISLRNEQLKEHVEQIYIDGHFDDSGVRVIDFIDHSCFPFDQLFTLLINVLDLDKLIEALQPWRPSASMSNEYALSTSELLHKTRLELGIDAEIEVRSVGYIWDMLTAARLVGCGQIYVPGVSGFVQSTQIQEGHFEDSTREGLVYFVSSEGERIDIIKRTILEVICVYPCDE